MGRILTVVLFGVGVWAVFIIGTDDDGCCSLSVLEGEEEGSGCGRWRIMERWVRVMSLAWRGAFRYGRPWGQFLGWDMFRLRVKRVLDTCWPCVGVVSRFLFEVDVLVGKD